MAYLAFCLTKPGRPSLCNYLVLNDEFSLALKILVKQWPFHFSSQVILQKVTKYHSIKQALYYSIPVALQYLYFPWSLSSIVTWLWEIFCVVSSVLDYVIPQFIMLYVLSGQNLEFWEHFFTYTTLVRKLIVKSVRILQISVVLWKASNEK